MRTKRLEILILLALNCKIVNSATLFYNEEEDEVCRDSCCIDCTCCGPGTYWDGIECVQHIDQELDCAARHLYEDGSCIDNVCVAGSCCGEGTKLVVDPTRLPDACYCVPSNDTPSPSQNVTPSPSQNDTPSPSQSDTPLPSQIVTPSPSQNVTPSPSQSATPSPSQSVTPSPSQSVTPSPSERYTITPSQIPTILPSQTPSSLPTTFPTQHCNNTLYIHAFGVGNPPPENEQDRARDEHAKLSSPICLGADEVDMESAQLIYNRNNLFFGGIAGLLDAVAGGNLQQMIVDAWNDNYKEVKISSHSNGVITIHSAWPTAKMTIEQQKFETRNDICDTMMVDLLHMQSAVSEYTDLISPVTAADWQAKDGNDLLSEIENIKFLFNSEDDATWDHFGFSTVGRREVVPWVIDNEQKADAKVRGRASILCEDDDSWDDFLDHNGRLSLETCPPRALATHPYNAVNMLAECDYSLDPCQDDDFDDDSGDINIDRLTPEGVCYQIW